MTRFKKIALITFSTLPLIGGAGVAYQRSTSADPNEDQLKRRLVPHDQIARSVLADLGDFAELFQKVPSWSQGFVPNLDSKWKATQVQIALGRPLNDGEAQFLAHLSSLPYGFRTVNGKVGTSRSSLAPADRIVEMYGSTGSSFVPAAGFTKSLLPDVDWTSPSSTP